MNILAFAYVFPPDSGSGTFRTLYFANKWAAAGDNVTVVTVREEDFHPTALVDPALVREIHPSIRISRAAAYRPFDRLLALRAKLRARLEQDDASAAPPAATSSATPESSRSLLGDLISGLLTFPDVHSGWIYKAVSAGLKVAKDDTVDCIYATGGPWSGLIAATLVQRRIRKPMVLDFRDPWASNPNLAKQPRWLQRAHDRAERFCIRHAHIVIANTDALREDFIKRYPEISPKRFACVTNGYEELPPREPSPNSKLTMIHAGELYLSRNPRNFLQALHNLLAADRIPRDAIQVRFVGSVPRDDEQVAKLLQELGPVVELSGRVPHAHALELQQQASALLLFQAGFPLQVPRKLYEYLSMKLPILAVTESSSATAKILADVEMPYVTEDDVLQIERVILKLYTDWRAGSASTGNPERIIKYSNTYLAARIRGYMQAAATN